MIDTTGLFATWFEALPMGATITHFPTDDPGDGALVAANPEASRILGFDLSAFVGVATNENGVDGAFDVEETLSTQQLAFEVATSGVTQIHSAFELEHGPGRGYYQAALFRIGERHVATVFRRVDTEIATSKALDWALQTMEASNSQLDQFASSVAHDLKNPLAGISGNAELLTMMKADLPAQAVELVQRIQELAAMSAEMIDGLLRFSRNASSVQHGSVDLRADVIDWVLSVLHDQVIAADATITVEPLPVVAGDAAALRQVFQNLIANSLRYRSPEVPCRIMIRGVPTERGARVEVIDNGIGISADDRARVFEWGFRGEAAGVSTGSGLGLATSRALLNSLGADISVDPEAGDGTVMKLSFQAP